VQAGDPLFPRIDKERAQTLLAQWLPEASAATGPAPVSKEKTKKGQPTKGAGKEAPEGNWVRIDEFSRLDLRTARIESATPVPKADKLLQIQVALGNGEHRQVVAGIADAYPPSDLVGKTVIFLANLKPATIRGVESQGMILAVGGKKVIGLATVDKDVPPGETVR